MTSLKNIRWLKNELTSWLDQGLISSTQLAAIESHYARPNNSRLVFSTIGAVVFGLGVILFFAYNWQDMHRLLKLFMILASIITSHGGAYWFMSDDRHNPASSEGLALLGSMLFGAAIWLISQIYHIDVHMPDALLMWACGVLAIAWVRLSYAQCLLAMTLLAAWALLEIFSYQTRLLYAPWIILLGTGALALILKSRFMVFLATCLFFITWFSTLLEPLKDQLLYLFFSATILLISLGILLDRTKPNTAAIFREAFIVPGFAGYLVMVFILTFIDPGNSLRAIDASTTTTQSNFFYLSLLLSFSLPILVFAPNKRLINTVRTDQLHALVLLGTACLVFSTGTNTLHLSHNVLTGLMNLIFIAHCLLFIVYRTWQSLTTRLGSFNRLPTIFRAHFYALYRSI